MSKVIIEHYRDLEEKKLKVTIEKRGIIVSLLKASKEEIKENSLDLFKDELPNAHKVAKQHSIGADLAYASAVDTKILFINKDEEKTFLSSSEDDYSIYPQAEVYMLDNDVQMGSRLYFKEYDKVRYQIVKIEQIRGLVNFKKFTIAKD